MTSLVDRYIVALPPVIESMGNTSLFRLSELENSVSKVSAIFYALASRLSSSLIAGNTLVRT